jgi:hypothetical protein
MTVNAGDTVHWTNNSTSPHTVTRCDNANCLIGAGSGTSPATFDSGTISGNGVGSFSQVFNGAGTYNYYCNFHGYSVMHGTVTVSVATTPGAPAASPAGAASPTSSATVAPRRLPPAGAGPRTAAGSAVAAGAVVAGVLLLVASLAATSVSILTPRQRRS